MKKLMIITVVFITTVFFAFIFKDSLLASAAHFLITEDEIKPTTYCFVLGGGSFDRGNEAAKLYKEGYCKKLVCTGENVPSIFKAMNIDLAESETAKNNIVKNHQIPEEDVIVLKKGTSTKEESQAILQFCKEHNITEAILLSGKYHTNRLQFVFKKMFQQNKINMMIHGAPSSIYDEELWWQSEEGLIAFNNEYVKTFYYWIKY